MTDRHAGYVVTLAEDIREDDAREGVLNAIRMVRGVISVTPVLGGIELDMAEERARYKLTGEIREILLPAFMRGKKP